MENMISDLKVICALLGIDNSDNGLQDCALAHNLLQRIILFLGGTE
jgi:hypothetical protein